MPKKLNKKPASCFIGKTIIVRCKQFGILLNNRKILNDTWLLKGKKVTLRMSWFFPGISFWWDTPRIPPQGRPEASEGAAAPPPATKKAQLLGKDLKDEWRTQNNDVIFRLIGVFVCSFLLGLNQSQQRRGETELLLKLNKFHNPVMWGICKSYP